MTVAKKAEFKNCQADLLIAFLKNNDKLIAPKSKAGILDF
jgi:hypothetical protein